MSEGMTPYYALRRQGYDHLEAVEILAINRAGRIGGMRPCGPDPIDVRRHVEGALRQAVPVHVKVADD